MKIINKKECYDVNDILRYDFPYSDGEYKNKPPFAEGQYGDKVDRIELAKFMIQLTNSALRKLVHDAEKKGVRLPIPKLSVDIKTYGIYENGTFYKIKVKVDDIEDWSDFFDKGILSEDD
tara:strand:+ start:150 stop:509 length:360 start_codon:yes stop_codon:yes gene_type:complete